jgi:hypothetical protein
MYNAVFWNVNAVWFLEDPHGVTSQKTPFFINTYTQNTVFAPTSPAIGSITA